MSKNLVYILAILSFSACASSSRKTAGRDYNVITQQEITLQNGNDAWEVITHLRPQFLKSRGRTSIQNQPSPASEYASVFLDGQYFGDVNSLRHIAALNIREIRYLPVTESVTRYGMQYGNGVIDIRTR